jgi:hypothetical protein
MIQKLATKEMEPKIYAIFLEANNGEGITQVVAYSLEEAIKKAKQEALINITNCDVRSINAKHWNIMSMGELKDQIFKVEISDVKKVGPRNSNGPVRDKANDIMKQIINTGNLELLEKNKKKLTKGEISYVKDKLSL